MYKIDGVFAFDTYNNDRYAALIAVSSEDCKSTLVIPAAITLNNGNRVDVTEIIGTLGTNGISSNSIEHIVIPTTINYILVRSFKNIPNLKTVTIRNPDAYIDEQCGLDGDITIIGFEDSTAEKYAREHSIKFKIIENIERIE